MAAVTTLSQVRRSLPRTLMARNLSEWQIIENKWSTFTSHVAKSGGADISASAEKSKKVSFTGGQQPRKYRVKKIRTKRGIVSKGARLVNCVKGLSNVKEEVYSALDSFIVWDLEFPLIAVKKALKTLQAEKKWKRIIQLTKWMLSKGQGKTLGNYFVLLNALAEEGRIEEAEELWTKLLMENLENMPRVFFARIITMYERNNMTEKLFEVFADMEELGIKPDYSTVLRVAKILKDLGMLDKYDKMREKYPRPKWEYRYCKGKRVKRRLQISDYEDNLMNDSDSNAYDEYGPTVEAFPTAEDTGQQSESL